MRKYALKKDKQIKPTCSHALHVLARSHHKVLKDLSSKHYPATGMSRAKVQYTLSSPNCNACSRTQTFFVL